nr:hypothetical protein TetV2_00059 [Oceanusvirus sp.]
MASSAAPADAPHSFGGIIDHIASKLQHAVVRSRQRRRSGQTDHRLVGVWFNQAVRAENVISDIVPMCASIRPLMFAPGGGGEDSSSHADIDFSSLPLNFQKILADEGVLHDASIVRMTTQLCLQEDVRKKMFPGKKGNLPDMSDAIDVLAHVQEATKLYMQMRATDDESFDFPTEDTDFGIMSLTQCKDAINKWCYYRFKEEEMIDLVRDKDPGILALAAITVNIAFCNFFKAVAV